MIGWFSDRPGLGRQAFFEHYEQGIDSFFRRASWPFAGFRQSPTAQTRKKGTHPRTAVAEKPVPSPTPADPAAEQAKFDEALALTSAADRAAALKAFLHDFPKSEHAGKAAELFVTARAIVGDERLQAGDPLAVSLRIQAGGGRNTCSDPRKAFQRDRFQISGKSFLPRASVPPRSK